MAAGGLRGGGRPVPEHDRPDGQFDDIPANINTRDNIVVLVDEAHRTTGGDLGTYLMAALPNATYIGFTGTPIDNIARGKGTFKVFGGDDQQGYLDKPMRDHVLLQAIARVNRPYEDAAGLVKPYGFVLDFVGIFEKLERALAFDSDVVASVIQNVDVLKTLFSNLITTTAAPYLPLTRGWDDKAKERAIDYFADPARREAFFKFFRQLQSLYDILSPDPFLRPYIKDYQALAELFGLVRNAYKDRVYVDKELTAKTKELLRRQTESGVLDPPGMIYSLGPNELRALKESDTSYAVKVLNLRKVLANIVDAEGGSKPFLLSIGERAEKLAQAYEERQITTQQALEEFEKLAQEAVEAEDEREELGIGKNAFAIYTTLKLVFPTVTAGQAGAVDALFATLPDHQWNDQQKAKLRAELYKVLLPLVGRSKMIDVANALLRLQRV